MSHYPNTFLWKVLHLPEKGQLLKRVAYDLGLSQQTVSNWRAQDAIDQGTQPGLTTSENTELALRGFVFANGRDLVEEVTNPKGFTRLFTG